MTGVTVADSRLDMGDYERDEAMSAADVTSNKLGLHKYCLSNPWMDGLAEMKNNNFIEVSANKDTQKDRKKLVAKFIIETVRDG